MKSKTERSLVDLVSQNLRLLRTEANLTQQELADRAGFKVSHISRLESTPQNVTLTALERLAKALNCSVARLTSPEEGVRVSGSAKAEFELAIQTLERFGKRLWSPSRRYN